MCRDVAADVSTMPPRARARRVDDRGWTTSVVDDIGELGMTNAEAE
jgi:hypothetical protein